MATSTGKQTHTPKRYISVPPPDGSSGRWKQLLILGVIALAVAVAVICIVIALMIGGRRVGPEEEADALPAPVGILMPDSGVSRWQDDAEALSAALSELDYTVLTRYAEGDPDAQIQQFQELREAGCGVILVAAVDANAMSAAITEFQTPAEDPDAESGDETDADTETGADEVDDEPDTDLSPVDDGLIIIAYDTFLSNCDYIDFYIGADPYDSGYLQAAFLVETLELTGEGGDSYNLEIFAGDDDDPYAQMYYAGGMDMLQPYIDSGELNVPSGQVELENCATEGGLTENARSRMSRILSSYYSDGSALQAVFCTSDALAQGVISALLSEYVGNVYPYVTGSGCAETNLAYLLSGYQAMDLVNYTDGMSEDAALLISYIMEYLYPPQEESENTGLSDADGQTDESSESGEASDTEDAAVTDAPEDGSASDETASDSDADVVSTEGDASGAGSGETEENSDVDAPEDGGEDFYEEEAAVYTPGMMLTGEGVTLMDALESVLYFDDYLDNGSIAVPALLYYGAVVTAANYNETLIDTGLYTLTDGALTAVS